MLLDLPFSTLGAIIGASETKPDKIAVASDFFFRGSPANLTQLAILAQQTTHSRDRCCEYVTHCLVAFDHLVNARHRFLEHDYNS